MSIVGGRSDLGELSPVAQSYVALVPGDDPIPVLVSQVVSTRNLLQELGDERATQFRYAAGKWTAKEILNHLTDTERIFAYRALRLARADSTALPSFEQDDYVLASKANDRTLSDLLDEAQQVRAASVALFRSFPSEAWIRKALVSGRLLSSRGVAFLTAGHELHHCQILAEKYLKKP